MDCSALFIALSKALEICFHGMTWGDFKELFLQQFEGNETPAARAFNVLSGKPKEGEFISLYASRLITKLLAKWKSLTHEQIAKSVVLAQAAHVDSRLQRTVYMANIKACSELQKELRSFDFHKKKDRSAQENSTSKRQRLHTPVRPLLRKIGTQIC